MPQSVLLGQYDWSLVALSIAIAIFASYTSLDLAGRTASSSGRARVIWLAGGSVAMGIGIWAMHYVGMLAFRLPVDVLYDVPVVLFSLFAAMVSSLVALLVVSRHPATPRAVAGGSVAMGLGIAIMHYSGMMAMRLAATPVYDPRMVALSVGIAIAVSYVALRLSIRLRDRTNNLWVRVASATVMGLAIAAMHYTGMAAVCFHQMPATVRDANSVGISSVGLFAIVAVTITVLALSLFGALADRRFSSQRRILEAEQERWRLMISANQDGLFDHNFVTGELFYSPRWKAIIGFGPDEFPSTREAWEERLHPADRRRVITALEEYLRAAADHTWECEYRLRHRDGTWRWILVRGRAIWDSNGALLRFVGSVADVTERLRREEELRASEGQYRELFQRNPLPSFIYAIETLRFLDVNEAAIRHYGWSREEFTGMNVRDIRLVNNVEAIEAELRACSPRNERTKPLRHRRNRKSEIWVELYSHEIEVAGRRARLVMADDVTDRIAAEEEIRRAHNELESLVVQRTSELRASEAKWRSLVESLPQFVWSATPDGQCEYIGSQWAQYAGTPQPELLGSGWLKTLHSADRDRVLACWQHATSTIGVYDVEYRIRSRDGAYRWFMARGSPVRNEDGEVTRWLGTTTDIEDQKRSEERLEAAVAERTLELAEARDRAECAARAKSSFLAAMSHEIRTPMNGVIGMTELLLETALTAEQRGYLGTIRSSGHALLTIINDVLDFSKIEAGKIDIENVEFDLQTVLEESMELMAPSAAAKGLHTSLEVGEDVPFCVAGDPGRFRQILLNILSNAIKFTAKGAVSVSVTKEAVRDGVMTLRIAVRDTGIGMTPDQLAGLFQAFTQADRSTTRRFGGTGLGLAISKRLIELMGGTIGVFSQPGEGTTFWFNICLSLSPSTVNGLVLLLDENPISRALVRGYLKRAGLDVVQYSQGVAVERERVALVVADSATLEALADLFRGSSLPRLDQWPAVILGSPSDWLTQVSGYGPGFTPTYVSKPFRGLDLMRAVRSAMAGLPASVQTPAKDPALDFDGARILLVEDNLVNQKVASLMLAKLGCRVQVAANGVEACIAMQNASFDLVLMDCQMPEMDGFEATRIIRGREIGRRTPIIALTAGVLREERNQCYAAGMDDFLSKPVARQDLEAALENWLSVKRPRVQI